MRAPDPSSNEPAPSLPPIRARDLDRIREKEPIYLEPRQILLFAGLGIGSLAVAFGLGWWLGRDASAPSWTSESPVCECPLGTSDPPSATPTLDSVRVVRSQVLPTPPEVEPRGQEAPSATWARRPPDVVPGPPRASTPSPTTPDGTPPPALAGTTVPLDPKAPGPVPTGESAGEASSSGTGEESGPHRASSATGTSHTEAQRGSPAKEPPGTETPIPLAQRRWSIQVRAYRDASLAQDYATALKKKGYSARVLVGRDGSGTPWYRVHVGRFATSAEAQRFAARFNAREGEKAIAVEGP